MTISTPEPVRCFDAVTSDPHVARLLARVDAAVARYKAQRDAGRVLANSLDAMRLELTYHSNAIEGNTLSLRETQLVLEGQSPPGGKSLREVYEARNHDRALRTVEDWATSRKDERITERQVLDIHAIVMADIDPRGAGRFRADRVLIKGTRYIPPASQKFDVLIPAMLALCNRDGAHPAVLAAELHYNLVAIHPFADGNGRTARLLMNLVLLRCGFPLTVIEVERRGEYLGALEQANDGRGAPFVAIVLESVIRSVERLAGD